MEPKQKSRAVGRPIANPVLHSSNGDRRNGYPFLSHGAAAFTCAAWQEIRRGLKLSARELQIVQGIFDDKLEYTIAAELGISINTVRTELRRLRRKLNAADRVSLILRVMEEFLRQTTSEKTTLPAICRDHSAGRCPLLRAVVGAKPDLTRDSKSERASTTAIKALQFLSATQALDFFRFSEFGLWLQG